MKRDLDRRSKGSRLSKTNRVDRSNTVGHGQEEMEEEYTQ